MGFHRTAPPQALNRKFLNRKAVMEEIERELAILLAEDDAAFANRTADPFLIDHDCLNPAGHDFASSCGAVARLHCARLAWR
jgi:hypothetical protein